MGHFEGVDHIAIAVHDIDASLSFYTDQLGCKLLHDEQLPSAGVRLAYLDLGNIMLQLVQPIGDTPIKDDLALHGEGLHHICLSARDIPELLGRMAGESATKVVNGGRGRLACFLTNRPNGVPIEVTELEPR